MTVQTASVSKQDMVARAKALAPAFRERAAAAEDDRRISIASATELLEAGFARMLVPRRLGGSELGIDAWFEVMLEIGRADASHAWCAGLMAHVPQMLLQFGEEAQQAIWSDGPDVPTAGSVMPFAKVVAVDGGYRVSAKAPFASGVTHSTWVFVGGFLPQEGPPVGAMFLIAPEQYEISDTWFTSGMRATGSNTIVAEDVFVPAAHVLRMSDLREASGPGRALSPGGIYRLPFMSYAPLSFATPMLGAARGAYDDLLAWAAGKQVPGGGRLAEAAALQTALGRVSADLEAAELLLRWVVDRADDDAATSMEHRRACMRNYSRAAELIVDATDRLVKLGGTFSFAESNPIQRAWRDVHFAAAHVSLSGEINYAQYARGDLDLPTPPTLQIY
jgi:3-hydroxy-9,10-secoandrosta-1,3,5(10)-triene-9,17-dione monooxygenase